MRCTRFSRECRWSDAFKQKRIRPSKRRNQIAGNLPQNGHPYPSPGREVLCDAERLQALEQIVQHFTGLGKPSQDQLNQVIREIRGRSDSEGGASGGLGNSEGDDASLETDGTIQLTLPPGNFRRRTDDGLVHSADLSHADFSRSVQQKLQFQSYEALPHVRASGHGF